VVDAAAEQGLRSAVVTFEPTPRELFQPATAPARLMTMRDKYERFDALGMDCHVVQRFSRGLAALSPEEFVSRLLVDGMDARVVVVGHDFRFGRDRAGDFDFLQAAGRRHGFETREVAACYQGETRISSTAVRAALAASDFVRAATLLGRPYTMDGRVVRGEQLGRKLGFPTINLRPRRQVLPLHGIFAVRVSDCGQVAPGLRDHAGVASLGSRPTVGGHGHLLEVHLFDFQGNLYGRRVSVEFVARLRDELHFDDLDAMTEQMHVDAAQARRQLGI
jgi:riboflavin kinase/FMN adenylyltransferase